MISKLYSQNMWGKSSLAIGRIACLGSKIFRDADYCSGICILWIIIGTCDISGEHIGFDI
ncbi:MAG: hypothetical protein JKY62_17350 [Desulfocapsa sp.]|nr:hypothetical protein [Desulfocapsa sp.]MBL4904393.1 hypothetical protein [Desulfocapsa sp.]